MAMRLTAKTPSRFSTSTSSRTSHSKHEFPTQTKPVHESLIHNRKSEIFLHIMRKRVEKANPIEFFITHILSLSLVCSHLTAVHSTQRLFVDDSISSSPSHPLHPRQPSSSKSRLLFFLVFFQFPSFCFRFSLCFFSFSSACFALRLACTFSRSFVASVSN